MKDIKIVSRWNSDKVLVCGKYESIKDCLEKNRGAYLGGANLEGAYLEGAYLRGAKNYIDSHEFTQELIKRHKDFTPKEWQAIGQIFTFRYCWDDIIKKFKKEAIAISRKLEKDGFDEYIKKLKGDK